MELPDVLIHPKKSVLYEIHASCTHFSCLRLKLSTKSQIKHRKSFGSLKNRCRIICPHSPRFLFWNQPSRYASGLRTSNILHYCPPSRRKKPARENAKIKSEFSCFPFNFKFRNMISLGSVCLTDWWMLTTRNWQSGSLLLIKDSEDIALSHLERSRKW